MSNHLILFIKRDASALRATSPTYGDATPLEKEDK